jgi:hypothetical protein
MRQLAHRRALHPRLYPVNPCGGRERDPCGEIPLSAFLPFGVEVQVPPPGALGGE